MNFNPVWWGLWLAHPNTAAYPNQLYFVPPCESSEDQPSSTEPEPQNPPADEIKPSVRRTWTTDEDQQLLTIIQEFQAKSRSSRIPYRLVAKKFSGRTSKQIRERYLNKLDPTINFSPFSQEEDDLICEFYKKEGARWKELSLIMQGRTTTMIKNRFNTKLQSLLLSRRKRRLACAATQGPIRPATQAPHSIQ